MVVKIDSTKRKKADQSTLQRLIDGTAQTIAISGIRGSTVEDILKTSNLSRRTFYQHFENKDDALKALYEQMTADLVRSVQVAIENTSDPVATIDAVIDAYLSYQHRGGKVLMVLQAEAMGTESVLGNRRRRTIESVGQMLAKATHNALGVHVHPLVFRTLLWGIEGLVLHQRRGKRFTAADRELVKSIVKPIMFNVLAGATNLPSP